MPCAGIFTPVETFHTFPANASADLKLLMRYGFPQGVAEKIIDTRGMTNWEVLQPECTALLFKRYWDWMNMKIASRMRQGGAERETAQEEIDRVPGGFRGRKCVIL